jgi:hypothetical protein
MPKNLLLTVTGVFTSDTTGKFGIAIVFASKTGKSLSVQNVARLPVK